MTPDDAKVIDINLTSYPIVNRSVKKVILHKNSEICTVSPMQKGKRLKQLDMAINAKYKASGIQQKVLDSAPGGITFPRKSKNVNFDGAYHKSTPHHFGEDPIDDPEVSRDVPTLTIYHRHKNKSHPITMECHLTGKRLKRFKTALQKHSKVFFNNPDLFPFLMDPVTKQPIYADLGLRDNAVLKAYPPIKMSKAHAAALGDLIRAKLGNGTFVELKPQPWSGQLLVVQKPKLTKDGEVQYRLVQSLLDLNKNCMYKQYKLPVPRELIEKLPANCKYYNSWDAKSSFDSIRLLS